MMSFNRTMLRKYFIMGSQNCKRDPVQVLEEAAGAGITAFQYREKGEGSLTGDEKINLGRKLREICKRHGIPFIVNDDVELVEILEADGIHVGQDDRSIAELRELFPDKIIGLSISDQEELEKSPLAFADYIGAGPMFPTGSKKDAKPVAGPEWIRELRRQHPDLPIVGIGGIYPENATQVLEAGADGVSFISAVTQAKDITRAVQNL